MIIVFNIHQHCPKSASKRCMHCAKGDFPHAHPAVYLHAIDTQRAVKCGIDAVMWCDVTANHRRTAHSIPHFTFCIPHAAVLYFTHSPTVHWQKYRPYCYNAEVTNKRWKPTTSEHIFHLALTCISTNT